MCSFLFFFLLLLLFFFFVCVVLVMLLVVIDGFLTVGKFSINLTLFIKMHAEDIGHLCCDVDGIDIRVMVCCIVLSVLSYSCCCFSSIFGNYLSMCTGKNSTQQCKLWEQNHHYAKTCITHHSSSLILHPINLLLSQRMLLSHSCQQRLHLVLSLVTVLLLLSAQRL